jgi:hypothetical protein
VGDALLAKAVGLVSFERGWQRELELFAETSPSMKEALSELAEAERDLDPSQLMRESLVFSKLPEPEGERSNSAVPQSAA